MEEPAAAEESVGGRASPKSGPRAHTREKFDAWRCVNHWLMSRFLPASRSGPGTPSYRASPSKTCALLKRPTYRDLYIEIYIISLFFSLNFSLNIRNLNFY